jgi:hypothetical protein
MRRRFLALVVSSAALGLGAGPAMAQDFSGQTAQQVAGSLQNAEANANSTQYNPSNSNISVRVLSPGDDGDVTQENNSYADADATNDNGTTQSVGQTQSGVGGAAVQEAVQQAANLQNAESNAESVQVKPQNRNINVRVLSPGKNGSVSQSNNSGAESNAHNDNGLEQDVTQDQSGGGCGCDHPKYEKGDSHTGGVGIQATKQKAINKQNAEANAESKQIKPSNTNISVRVLSEGHDGDVTQENNSYADADATNDNDTSQSVEQSQAGSGSGGVGVQEAAQGAFNLQNAEADAESKQIEPENKNINVRVLSDGHNGSVSQANNSGAKSKAHNDNELEQNIDQEQSGSGCGCDSGYGSGGKYGHGTDAVGIQAAGQKAVNLQNAEADAESKQIKPSNTNTSVRVKSYGDDGDVEQENNSYADADAKNDNDTAQSVGQSQSGSGSGGVAVQEAGQEAFSFQNAEADAESLQVKPENENAGVRVFSSGGNGSVDQSNNSGAESNAHNDNGLEQDVTQDQSGGCGCDSGYGSDPKYGDKYGDKYGHDSDTIGIQAAGQKAVNLQNAEADADSFQYKPSNSNASVRFKSYGYDGDVDQENNSYADADAKNDNDTTQSIEQSQDFGDYCGCKGDDVLIQAAGQAAFNLQNAEADAESKQIEPENKALSLRFFSWGGGGDLEQSNWSFADSFARNENDLDQYLDQEQGG